MIEDNFQGIEKLSRENRKELKGADCPTAHAPRKFPSP